MPLQAPNFQTLSDIELARYAVSRDVTAIRLITTRNNQRLFRTAWSVLRNHMDAEDAVQETYMKAFASLEKYTGQSSLSTWLTRIVLNTAIDRQRKRKKRRSELLENDVAMIEEYRAGLSAGQILSPESELARTEISVMLKDAVARLPDDFRPVFVLRDIEGMSVRETAETLDIKEATVKSRLYRARRLLREDLQPSLKSIFTDALVFAGADCETMTSRVLISLSEQENKPEDFP